DEPAGIDVEALNRVKLNEAEPSTLSVDDPSQPESALPFRKGEAQAPPPVADEVESKPKPALGATVAVGVMSPFAQPLPFGKATPEHSPAGEPAATAAPAAEDSGAALASAGDIRLDPNEAKTLASESAPAKAPAASSAASGMMGTSARAGEDTSVTSALPDPGGAPPAAPAHLESMTVEQYASLCAECAVHPSWVDQIHGRYHVRSREERSALDAHWRARMAADVQLTQHFRWHYARFEQAAKQQKQ
ncbi:MAG: hypothetical protein JRI23_22755, partial [Deltaproteobacteria bacterium]|nr:hypothetical protein [Deltaproteobacteria bacterium]MBW2534789.1 hypothetical protein [Deltaproteobacteria bacterium]